MRRDDNAAGRLGNALASDKDRDRTIDLLKAAFVEGRLTKEEHELRVGRAFGSRTYADLAVLSADLPSSRLAALPSGTVAASARPPEGAVPRTNRLAVASLVCGLIPILPATLAAIVLGIGAHRQIRRTGERGAALAVTGVTLAALALVLTVLVFFVL
ncbi:MAG: DUF1707 and DUF4190 domain-containing protein [Actinomycetota bacterium]|nr:DUF1707 and DUF4190 domain-containing protein [Actinomycetota bacterium]